MSLNRRELLGVVAARLGVTAVRPAGAGSASAFQIVPPPAAASRPLATANGDVDWRAVRELFPLSPDWTHLASFLLASHPRPVTEAIARFREKIDADPLWIEAAAFSDAEGRPFAAVKQTLADYVGGRSTEICLTSNTTTALAVTYHGLRIRSNQEILTTEHDHYSHHESMRFAAARSGCTMRYVALYDRPADASATQIVDRLVRAIRPTTRAVGVTWVHSSTGVKIPLVPIAQAIARANRGRASADRCLLVVDGVHGFGNQDVDVAKTGCDFFASGTHKWLCGPRGTGFLWGRSDAWPELRPTIPTFDPDAPEPWAAWMERRALPPTRAAFVSPGGFPTFEHVLAIPAAVALHTQIGRERVAARIRDLNAAFRNGVAAIPGVTLHTPRSPELSGGISCFEVAGVKPDEVSRRLEEKKIRTNSSPYKVSYARVAAGVMNSPDDIDRVLRAVREMTG